MAIPFYDNLDLKNNKIENVGVPNNDNDAVNKQYLDNELTNLHTTITGEIEAEISNVNESIGNVNDRIDELDGEVTTKIDARINEVTPNIIEESIIDDLISTDTNKSLSANQGRVLDERIDAIRDLIIPNNYSLSPVEIGTFFDNTLYRVVITGNIDTTPNFNNIIRLSASDDVEPGKEYNYNVINVYGSFTTNYDVLNESIDIPKTYKMFEVDCLSANNLTKAYIYLGNVDVTNNEIHTWLKLGTDFQGIFNGHPEILPINYRVVIEFTRQEIISPEGE